MGTSHFVPNIGTMYKSLHSQEHARLIAWLKQQRLDQGLTMRELANKLDVSHSLVGKVELGERRLDVVEYLQYCDALDVSPCAGLEKVNQTLSK